MYSVSLKFSDKTYKFSANTIQEALDKIKPDIVKSKGVLFVKKGKLKTEMVVNPVVLRRMVRNPTLRRILDKRLNRKMGIEL